MTVTVQDKELKARHRAMWASGDYARMVETFLLPIGPRLVQACDITTGQQVLDVAAGTGNASIPAAARGARVTASDLTPELLDEGRRRAEAAGLRLEWTEADAEHLPFDDGSFDVVVGILECGDVQHVALQRPELHTAAEQRAQMFFTAPQRRRLRAGRGRWRERLHRPEQRAQHALRCPTQQPYRAAGTAHAYQLVRGVLVVRR